MNQTKNENYIVTQLPTTPESVRDYHTSGMDEHSRRDVAGGV